MWPSRRAATFFLLLFPSAIVWAQQPCAFSAPAATFSIPHVKGHTALTLDEAARIWKKATAQSMTKDCSRQIDYPNLKTRIRGFWTDSDLYLLFRCPYTELNLFLPEDHSQPRVGLWDRDVVEMFLGDDWTRIRHYREFEIAPTGDWITLAIDLDQKNTSDHTWQSGWQTWRVSTRNLKFGTPPPKFP